MSPDSISFIYAAQYISNPASAFGHSFLRFYHAAHKGLLGYSLSYFAKTDSEDSSLVYAFKGLFGGYLGSYEFDNYYPKTHLYNSVENRDLWEYKLKFSPEERLRIVEHSRELALAGHKKYYFQT